MACRCGLAFLVALLAAGLVLGVLFKRLMVDPILPHGALQLAIATMALSIVLQNGMMNAAGAVAYSFPGIDGGIAWGAIFLDWQSLTILAARGRCRGRAQPFPRTHPYRPGDPGERRRIRRSRACSASTSRAWC